MTVEWGKYQDAYRAIWEALTENSLSVFDADLNFGEALRLVRYKGELYVFISPLGQVWRFDSKNWKMVYDVGEKVGRNPTDQSNVYSKWAMASWDAHHWSRDDKLYFVGTWFPQSCVAVLRYTKSTDTWEFFNLLSSVGGGEFLSVEEFGDYLYCGSDQGEIWRSSNGETWTKVFSAIPGFKYVPALAAGANRLKVGLVNQENGTMNPTLGKIYTTTDGTTWVEDLDIPLGTYGGPNSIAFGSIPGQDYFLMGTNFGYVFLWDGGYSAWRLIGKVGLPVLDIKQKGGTYSFPGWLLCCGHRSGNGSLWQLHNGRLLQMVRTYGHSMFSSEVFNEEVYYSWGWADIPSTTYVRGHYAGVKKIKETLLELLGRQEPSPTSDSATKTTTDNFSDLVRFNLGNWRNRVLSLRNTGSNAFRYCVLASRDGCTYINTGEFDGPQAGYAPIEIDFSESPYNVICIQVRSTNSGQPTTAEGHVACW